VVSIDEDLEPTANEYYSDANNQQRLKICVNSGNPRTASLFHSQTLRRTGNGKFDYIVSNNKRCPNVTAPVTVRMLYQKAISGYTQAQLNALFNSPDKLVIIMGDEFCRCPVEICSNRAHARQYYSQSYVDYVTQNPSLDGTPTVYLPLGPRLEFQKVTPSEIVLSSSRELLFNLIVSPTSPSRKRLANMVAKEKLPNVFVHVTPAFSGNASEAKGFVPPEEYRKILLNSKFTLCPAGHNPEAFRLFEASEAGSIPIIVKDEEYQEHFCKDSFAPLLASGAPFIVLNSWDELTLALQPFVDDPSLLDEKQKALKHWYLKFWSEIARDFECSISANIDKLIKQGKTRFDPNSFDMPECGDDDDDHETENEDEDESKKKIIIPPSLPTKLTPTPLIVGCGRTGTLSLSHYLVKSVGATSVHEKIEPSSISVSWLYAIPDAVSYPFEGKKSPAYRKWKLRKLTRRNLPLFHPVVQVVRHPLKVISSTRRCFCGRGTRSTGLGQASDASSWQFVDQHIKMPKPNLPYDSLLRSMTYWYEWNILIPKKHNLANRFRIEDLDPNELVSSLGLTVPTGVDLPHRVPKAPGHVSPETEKELLPDATWKDLFEEDEDLARKIFALAKEYGYEAEAEKIEDLM
jgi:hypothetical protein